MDFATAQTELNTILSDSDDVTFESSEKERALTKAWNDSFVVNEVWDTSLTYSTGTYQYAVPAALDSIKDIYFSPLGDTQPYPDPIDASLWDEVNGNIQFNSKADRIIPSGYKLYLKGAYKLTTSDLISDPNMQEYVLSLAGVNALSSLGFKKVNRFLKNDTTLSEIIGLRRELQNDVIDLRRKLKKSWESF